ncbi:hypothetical protein D9V37_05495 [Nocardioides mangrovicus]|uniref:3-keto-5-aminohexanoate cleavage protein n=1 Tax=Nocardioides mangrovicus TaxID=2478913 RepID=A0A3L8P655_9ACTN|nr:3-keto-5-aminohexanoate cleavage protein [Nocardioides mangrovicus]RLV50183.1 hypothetical protein D9V37_05495 [Nocardioides mangrovicus]
MLQVTPNGPYGKDRHPALPIAAGEVLADLRACFAAGAEGVHLHVRDHDGAETLAPEHVNATCEAVRAVAADLGLTVEVGLTTGAWIHPGLAERIAMVREWQGVDCATVNLSEPGYEQLMAAMLDVGIGVDVGLWAPQELPGLLDSGLLPHAQRVSIELDEGEPYFLTGDPLEVAARTNDALDAAGSTCPRLTHGAGPWTWPLVHDAFRRGHDTRVGFEDSTALPDGTTAADNADLVRHAVRIRNETDPAGS